jgi:hypothetical protein
MQLPEDTHLAYHVWSEAWYTKAVRDKRPSIGVAASAQGTGGGVAWAFQITQYELGGKDCTLIEAFSDAYAAFTQVPELFAAFAEHAPGTLAEVRGILDNLGAVDETARVDPHIKRHPAKLQG